MVKEGGPRRREGGRREGARARYRRVAGALQRKALTALAGQSAGFVRRTGCPVDLTFCLLCVNTCTRPTGGKETTKLKSSWRLNRILPRHA